MIDVSELEKMAEAERRYAEELAEISKLIRHPVLSSLFKAISKDSEKHGEFYAALAKLFREVQPLITEEELKIISEAVEKHIETERRMIETAKKLLDSVQDTRAKVVLEAILRDEVEHHKLLITIRDRIARPETFTEQDFWDWVWKHSPWHGSPGG